MFRFFTGNSQVIHSRIKALTAQLDVLEASVHAGTRHSSRLETQIDELRSELVDHKAALHKLRGQVHGPKGADSIPRLPARQVQLAESKDDLRRRAGIVAGKYPAAHSAAADPPQDDEG